MPQNEQVWQGRNVSDLSLGGICFEYQLRHQSWRQYGLMVTNTFLEIFFLTTVSLPISYHHATHSHSDYDFKTCKTHPLQLLLPKDSDCSLHQNTAAISTQKSCNHIPWHKFFTAFLIPYKQISEQCLKLHHDHCPSHSLQSVIQSFN